MQTDLHLLIGIDDDSAVSLIDETRRKRNAQFTAGGVLTFA